MPQARLPDVNTAFNKHRNEAISCLKSEDYAGAIGSLFAWNALLPDILETIDNEDGTQSKKLKYRIVISDIDYNNLAKPSINVFCYHCDKNEEKPILYNVIRFFDLILPYITQCLLQVKSTKAWRCPNCNKSNILSKTRRLDKIAETKLKEPYYLGVVPQPPIRQGGLLDRTLYHNEMEKWIYNFISELENKSAAFRDDNWNKEGDKTDFSDNDIDGGEEDE